jgi:hypothetical protein
MSATLTSEGVGRLESLAAKILTAYHATGGLPGGVQLEDALDELKTILDRHKGTLTKAGAGFVVDLARGLVGDDPDYERIALEHFDAAELAAFAEAGADRVEELVERTVVARALLVDDLKAMAIKAAKGALSAALMAALAL